MPVRRSVLRTLALAAFAAAALAAQAAPVTLLNVSYDVAREFYKDYDAAFIAHWKQAGGEALVVNQSHGGSSKQARSVLDGLEADVVTMNQATDIDVLADRGGLLPANWATRLPEQQRADDVGAGHPRQEGQPQGPARLGRPGQGRRQRGDPESEDLGQRPLHLPGRVGQRAQVGRHAGAGARAGRRRCSPTCPCSTAAAAPPPPPSRNATSATRW